MGAVPRLREAGQAPKRRNGDGRNISLSPLEWLANFYRQLQEAYHWTVREIDETEMEILILQVVVLDKIENATRRGYIEDILPF